MKRAGWLVAGVCVAYALVFSGCGGGGSGGGVFVPPEGDATTETGSPAGDSSTPAFDSGSDGVVSFGDGQSSCPSTCAGLGADCGAVTDTKCGGIIQCGTCEAGTICGGGGKPNVCGSGGGGSDGGGGDACSMLTCAGQKITCGQAGDGCGGTLQCGACSLPQSCGGDPAKPGQCGCTGVCAQVPTCAPGTTTTLTGTVWDPAGLHPLYNALVYVPNDPSDPGLQPFPAGITCDVCGATAAGNPLVTTFTAPDGTFTLTGMPAGSSVPLVVQLGRWRRQFTVDVATSCGANAVPAKTLTMPKNHTEGDIPRIGVLTGGYDPMECVLRKMGVQDSEFTNPGGAGHIQFYLAAQPNQPANPFGPFASVCPTTLSGATAPRLTRRPRARRPSSARRRASRPSTSTTSSCSRARATRRTSRRTGRASARTRRRAVASS